MSKFNTYQEFLNESNTEEYYEISTKIFKKMFSLLKREKKELSDLWKEGLHADEDPRFNIFDRWWGFTDESQIKNSWGPFWQKPGDIFTFEFETIDSLQPSFRGYPETDTYQVAVIPLRNEIRMEYADTSEKDIPEGTRTRFEKCLNEAIKTIPPSKLEKFKGRVSAKSIGLI